MGKIGARQMLAEMEYVQIEWSRAASKIMLGSLKSKKNLLVKVC